LPDLPAALPKSRKRFSAARRSPRFTESPTPS